MSSSTAIAMDARQTESSQTRTDYALIAAVVLTMLLSLAGYMHG